MNNTETLPDTSPDLEKQAWKGGASELRGLNEANAAPLAPEAARSGLKKWLWRLSLLVAFALGLMLYSKYQADKAISTEITKPAVQVTPPAAVIAPAKQPPKKATKPVVESVPTVASVPPVVLPVATKTEPIKQIIVERNNAPLPPSPPSPP